MNSEPSLLYTGTVIATITIAPAITAHFHRNAQEQTGSYTRIVTRLMGCSSSEWILPTNTALVARDSQRGRKLKFFMCVNTRRIAGSSVIASTAATIMQKFFVQ